MYFRCRVWGFEGLGFGDWKAEGFGEWKAEGLGMQRGKAERAAHNYETDRPLACNLQRLGFTLLGCVQGSGLTFGVQGFSSL